MKSYRLWISASLGAVIAVAGCGGDGGGDTGSGGAGGSAGTGAATTTAATGGATGSGGVGATAGSGGAGTTTGTGGGAGLKYFTTCGDPVCGKPTDDPRLTGCTGQQEGAACSQDGELCELDGDDCNANLLCAATDPKEQSGGCPKSLASTKHDIVYLSPTSRDRIRDEVVTMPLATWKYNDQDPNAREHLGFIIDDQPATSPAVRSSGERVDLYGYTSMAVAAIQAQDAQIRELREEVTRLREEIRAGSGGTCTTSATSTH